MKKLSVLLALILSLGGATGCATATLNPSSVPQPTLARLPTLALTAPRPAQQAPNMKTVVAIGQTRSAQEAAGTRMTSTPTPESVTAIASATPGPIPETPTGILSPTLRESAATLVFPTPTTTVTAAPVKTQPAATLVHPTLTLTVARPPATPTLWPTRKPAPTRVRPTATQTATPATPGVDVLAERGAETCAVKLIDVPFSWFGQRGSGHTMWYWDKVWSVHPVYVRPNIKLNSVYAQCGKTRCLLSPLQGQARSAAVACTDNLPCQGLAATLCVYVDAGAPSGERGEIELTLLVASGTKAVYGPVLETPVMFGWQIK